MKTGGKVFLVHHVKKAYRGVEEQFQVFLALVLDGGEW
jgi:hypothetical protein